MSVKIVFCVHRLPTLGQNDFLAYWADVHGPLVRERAEALHIRRYEQSHPVASRASSVLAAVRGAPPAYDGIASLWFDSLEDMTSAGAEPAGRQAARELLEDERRFIDLERSPIWVVQDHRVV